MAERESGLERDGALFEASMTKLTRRVKAMKAFKPLLEQVCELGKQVQKHVAEHLQEPNGPAALEKSRDDLRRISTSLIMNDNEKAKLMDFLESNLTVVIVGMVNSGKTALVNALLGKSWLKVRSTVE